MLESTHKNKIPKQQQRIMINFLFKKIFCGNLNEAVLLADIASFRFPRKIFFKKNHFFVCVTIKVRLLRTGKTMGSYIQYIGKVFGKIKTSDPLIRTHMCAYQGVRNVSFSKTFSYMLNKLSICQNVGPLREGSAGTTDGITL